MYLTKFLNERRGITYLNEIHFQDLSALMILMKKKGNKPQSLKTAYAAFHAYFSWLCAPNQQYLPKNIMSKIECPKIPKQIIHAFTSEEVRRMIHVFRYNPFLEIRNRCMICMLADCGLRAIELRRIKLSDIRHDYINVLGKGNKERIVPMSPILKKIMIRYNRERSEYIKRLQYAADPGFP